MTLKNDLGISISVYHRRIDCLAIDYRNRHHLPPLPRRSLFVCQIYSLCSHSLNVKNPATTIPLQPPSLISADSLLDFDHTERSSGTRQSCQSSTSHSTWTPNRDPLISFGAIRSFGMCMFFIFTYKEREPNFVAAGLTSSGLHKAHSSLAYRYALEAPPFIPRYLANPKPPVLYSKSL